MTDKSASVDELVLICIHVHANFKQLSADCMCLYHWSLHCPLVSDLWITLNIRSRCAPSLVVMYCSAVTMHQQHVSYFTPVYRHDIGPFLRAYSRRHHEPGLRSSKVKETPNMC